MSAMNISIINSCKFLLFIYFFNHQKDLLLFQKIAAIYQNIRHLELYERTNQYKNGVYKCGATPVYLAGFIKRIFNSKPLLTSSRINEIFKILKAKGNLRF
jgi:hypothetical protein